MRWAHLILGAALAVSLGALTAGGLGGCSWFSSNTATLIADSRSPIADVPVPTGFKMTSDSISRVVPASGLRIVDHQYKGNDAYLPVVRFYRDQMPDKGWTLVEQTQASGNEIALHYTKGNEDCVVTVSSGTFDTRVRVKIDPKTGPAAPK